MKNKLSTLLEHLANECLLSPTSPKGYTDKELMNATLVFSHFLTDIIWSENQDISRKARAELAENVGKAIRELILVATGKDMHEVVRNLSTPPPAIKGEISS